MPSETKKQTAQLMRAIGAELRRLREANAMSQQSLAEMVQSSRSHLCQVELGRTWPSAEFLSRCEEALNAPGKLLTLLRAAKVPVTTEQHATAYLNVTSHKFMPIRLDGLTIDAPIESVDVENYGVTKQSLKDEDGNSCDLYLFPWGVGVVHLAEDKGFANIAHLAMWRHESYPASRRWVKALLNDNCTSDEDLTPPYVSTHPKRR